MQSWCRTLAAQPLTLGSGSSITPHPRYENPISLWNTNVWTKKSEWGDPDWAAVSRQEPPGQSCRAGTEEAHTPGKWWLGWPQDSPLAAGISIPLHANAGLAYREMSPEEQLNSQVFFKEIQRGIGTVWLCTNEKLGAVKRLDREGR